MKSNNVVPLALNTATNIDENTTSGNPSLKASILANIQAKTKQYIHKHLSNVFNQVDDYLFDQSGRLMEGVSPQALLDTMLMLRKNRDSFAQTMQADVEKQLSKLNHPTQQPNVVKVSLPQPEELELLDKSQLEKTVCINTIINHGTEENRSSLKAMESALCLLFNQHKIKHEDNPLSPYFLCHSFLNSCEQFDIELPVYLIIFKHFERLFSKNLNELYGSIIGLLDTNNLIVKDNKSSFQSIYQGQQPTQVVQSNTAQQTELSQHDEEITSLANSINLLTTLANSTAQLHQPQLPINQIKPSLTHLSGVLTLPQLVQQLNQCSNQPLYQEPLNNIIPSLVNSVFKQTSQNIAKPDEDILNLTCLFFDFILNDENQPELTRNLIAQLQLPVLTLALNDKSFFQSSDHPARKFINLLAKSGFTLAHSNEQQYERITQKLKDVVQQVKDSNDINTALFEQQNQVLSEFLARDEHRIKLLEKRVEQAEKGKAQLEHDSKAVAKKMRQILQENPTLGVPIKAFLSNEWKKVMLQTLLKTGQNSHQWQEQNETLDSLVALCKECLSKTENSTLEESFARVKAHVLKSLEESGINSNAKDLIFMNLVLFKSAVSLCEFNESPEDASDNTDFNPPQQPKSVNIEADEPAINCDQSRIQSDPNLAKRYIEETNALVVGQWFELKDAIDSEESKRVKLVVKLDIVDRYVFMDASGKKAGEFSQMSMAAFLESGQIKVLDNSPLTERAVIDISEKLSES